MSNPFDQFDQPSASANPFDQFDPLLAGVDPDVPTPEAMKLESLRAEKAKQEREQNESLFGDLLGIGETALSMATGAVAGAPVMVGTTLKEIGKSILSGEYGKPEEAQRIQDLAMQAAGDVTYQPRTEEGQEMLETASQALEPLAAFSAIAPQMAGVSVRGLSPKGEFSVKNITSKGKAATRRKQLIADEIAKGNPEIKGIVDAIDPRGELINKRTNKAFSKVLDDDKARNATITLDRMSATDKKKFNEMLDIVEKQRALGTEYAAVNRPSQVVGKSIADRVRALQKVRQSANKQLSKSLKDIEGEVVNIDTAANNFLQKMQESGVKFSVDDNGKIASNLDNAMFRLGDVLPKSEFDNIINKIYQGVFDANDAHKYKQFLREFVDYDSGGLTPVGAKQSRVISDAIKQLSSDIADEIGNLSEQYEIANRKFSTVADPINKASKMLGNFDLDSPLTDNRAGQLARRLASDAITKDQVLDIIQSSDSALSKNKVRFNDNVLSQVAALALIDDVFNTSATQSPFGFKSQISSAVGATGGSTGGFIMDTAGAAIKKIREKDFDSKMNILRNVSKSDNN